MQEKAIYLKINRSDNWAIKNLSRWVDISYLMHADCYIVCDSQLVREKIENELILYSNPVFIESAKNEETVYIIDRIADANWKNASYAHITTFYEARNRGYKKFWNIDADDTRMCVSIDRMFQILCLAEDVAIENKLDCFSLDMWNSKTQGRHWSFGVTFVNNELDWFSIFRDRCQDQEFFEMDVDGNRNIDWFFSYLRNYKICKNELFYVENMRFVHYANDFLEKPITSGLYHWKKGKLCYPFMYYGFGIEEYGEDVIPEDIYCLDINLSDQEGTEILAYYARESGMKLTRYYSLEHIVNQDIVKLKNEYFLKKNGFSEDKQAEIVCFGAGNAFVENIRKIKTLYNLKYVCDNAPSKWGKEIVDGIICISPKQLQEIKNAFAIITMYSRGGMNQIAKQLDDLRIPHASLENWFLIVE